MRSEHRISKLCLLSGLAVPAVLWSTIFICARYQQPYSHTSRMVSELGELGTATQRAFTIGLVSCAILSVIFISTLYHIAKQCKLSVWPILIISTLSFSIGLAGLFPYPTPLHEILGSPVVALFLSPLLAMILWRSIDRPRGIIPLGIIALIFMLCGFSTFFPDFLPGAVGLKQRSFHLGWSIWFIYLGISFYTKGNPQPSLTHGQSV